MQKMCRPLLLLLMVVTVCGGASGAGISHLYPRSARQAVPYLAHLLESRSSPHDPVVGLLPLSGQCYTTHEMSKLTAYSRDI
jgi:hypothetical protein